MKEIKLNVRVREGSGKKLAKHSRAEGGIPGILYGHKEEPVSLIIPEHDFWTILHHATTEHLIMTVDIEGMDSGSVLTIVKEVQHHPVSGKVLHVDLQRIAPDEKIKVAVPVDLTGVAKGVREFGGVLDYGVRTIRIITTAATMPESLKLDVTELMIGDSIHVSDIIEKYKDFDIFDDAEILVGHVSIPKKLEDIEAEAAEEDVEAAEGEEETEASEVAETEEDA